MKIIIAVLAVAFAAMFAPRADAAGMFGEQDNFNTLQKLSIPASVVADNGLPKEWSGSIELVEHSTTLFIFAGVNISDKGYAIKETGTDNYWPLTDEAVKALQDLKILPDPMPPHDIGIVDLIFGYSLWIVIALVAAFYGVKALFFKKKSAAPEATAPPTAPPAGGGPRAGT